MTRYMLLQDYAGPAGCKPMTEWDPADVKAHIEFQIALNQELAGTGELVDAQALAGPDLARFVIWDGQGAPVVTDGPFPESKELLAGYRMVDVASEARAIEIAAPGVGRARSWRRADPAADRGPPGPGYARASDRPDRRAAEDLLRELAPQVLGVLARRYGDFGAAEDAVQEALLAAATHWPERRDPGQPARLADPGRRTGADRPVPQRHRPAAPRTGRARRASRRRPR